MFNETDTKRLLDLFERYVVSQEKDNTIQERAVKCQEQMAEIAKEHAKVGSNFIGTVTKGMQKEMKAAALDSGACSFCKKEGAGERDGPQHHNWCTKHA